MLRSIIVLERLYAQKAARACVVPLARADHMPQTPGKRAVSRAAETRDTHSTKGEKAARLVRPGGYLVVVGYRLFVQFSGIPTTFERSTGEPAAIEGYVHLFSEHVQAGGRYGWLLRELHESLIDDEWIARRPRTASRQGWPVSFACLWQQQS